MEASLLRTLELVAGASPFKHVVSGAKIETGSH